ncbi:MAG: hypothetical protein ACT4OD_06760 [Candidatus Nitrosotenuis sp.]
MSFADEGVETINIDDRSLDVSYSVDGEILAIEVDQESASLLVGLDQIQESIFEISFPSELLAAEDASFIVLVDGLETDYTVSYDGNNPTITVPIPEATEEIEIIGTSVIPELPLGVLAIMGIVSAVALVFSKSKLAIFK